MADKFHTDRPAVNARDTSPSTSAGDRAPGRGPGGAELSAWLRDLPHGNPLEAVQALHLEASAQISSTAAIRTRLKHLELLREKTESLLPVMERRLDQVTLPLSPPLRQAVVSVNDLLKVLAVGYADVVNHLSRRWYGLGSRHPLATAITQAMRLNQRRLRLAYRVHARGSTGAWLETHRLYRAAVDAGIERQALPNGGETPARIYVHGLLLAFAEPAKFAAGDLDRVRFYLDRYGDLATLDPADAADAQNRSSSFLIRGTEPRPGTSLARAPAPTLLSGDLILRCDALVARLQEQLAGLPQGIAPHKLGLPKEAERDAYRGLLGNLARLWSAPPSRRFPRTRFHPRADVVVGCTALRRFLAGSAYRRRAQDAPPEVIDDASMSEWVVTDESPDGLGLRYVGGDAAEVQVGEILGVRHRGASLMHVCIVRRAESAANHLDIGVQVLASHAMAARIALPESGKLAREPLNVMLLPRLPGFRDAPALLAAPSQLEPGTEFIARIDGHQRMLRIGNRVEKTASCELFSLEKADTAKQSAETNSP